MSNFFSVQNLKNVSVTNNCVIINKGAVVKASTVGEKFYEKYQSLKFRLKYFFPIFLFGRKPHILATNEWSKNYCHFLWEVLSKLIELKKSVPNGILILPKSYLKIDFAIKCLAAFGFNEDKIQIIPKKSHLRIKNLFFIPCINIATPGYYDFLKFSEIAQTLTSYYKEKFQTNFGARIYISRSDPSKNTARKIHNEDELTLMLTKYSFKTVYMENFSFLEQISIMYHAKYIIAPHGAGITNIMFARKDRELIEMVNQEWSKTCFAEMCERMKIKYHRIDCIEAPGETREFELRDIEVDTVELEEKLTKILR